METNIIKKGEYDQPIPAVGNIEYSADNYCKLPDIIKLGTLKHINNEKEIYAFLPFRGSPGIAYVTTNIAQQDVAHKSIETLAYRLLLSVPIRQSKFYILDNDKNGASFSNLFGLDDKIVEPKVWDDESEITDGLKDIKNKVPVIISKQLQNKFYDLAEYNENTPHSNQAFQFILIANFPMGFNQESTQMLLNLIKNGYKAGVYVLMSINENAKVESGIDINAIKRAIQLIDLKYNTVVNNDVFNNKFIFSSYDTVLPKDIDSIKKNINKAVNKLNSVTIDMSDVITSEWNGDASGGIKIPIGLGQDNENLDFIFGLNTDSHHALIGGATGSGKSVLLHNIIVFGSYIYSPHDLQYLLLDYKEGTEFKIYENLPHIKVLSIGSKREYGVSVLEFLQNEITKRGQLFKKSGAGNLKEYINNSNNKIPRYVIIIDEFQVLLNGNDSISSKASILIEDVSRRGRSFGVNMILATQSLGDVDISSSTLSNIGLRIGMKMTEMDCTRILSIDNDIPLKFSRPGESVYNTQNGLKEGNKLFQCAFVSKKDIDKKINYLNTKKIDFNITRFINDGSSIASASNNIVLQQSINNNKFTINNNFTNFYIAEPTVLNENHISIRLRKQAESNVFMVGDDPQSVISVIYYSLFQLIKQSAKESKFYVFNLFDIDSGYQEALDELKSETENIKIYTKHKALEKLLERINTELNNRINEEGSSERIVLVLLNTQKVRSLQKDGYDDSLLATQLLSILKDGPDYGIHTFMHIQNNNQLTEIFESKVLNEFENKIIFKGCDIYPFIDDMQIKNIDEQGLAYLNSPLKNNEVELIKIYQKNN